VFEAALLLVTPHIFTSDILFAEFADIATREGVTHSAVGRVAAAVAFILRQTMTHDIPPSQP